jgi:cytochrome c biogenesis protein CcmG/thiol:disulfide interchange protein DsbE
LLKANLLLILCFLMVGLVSLPEVIGAEKAYDFTLVDTEGREFSLSDFRGKYVLIDFFAIWCKPCELSLPHLKELKHQLGTDIIIISIDIDVEETEQQVIDYKQVHGMDWIVARDTEYLSMPYRVSALPTFVLIDPSGNIVNTYVGVIDETIIMRDIPLKPTSESPTTTETTGPQKPEQSSNQNWLFFILLIIAIIIGWMIIRKRGKKRKK